MKVFELPEFYLAFAFDEGTREKDLLPSQEELESFRRSTADFLLTSLKINHPGLTDLAIKLISCQVGSEKPDPRFQLYFEVQATAHFSEISSTDTDVNKLLESLLSQFGAEYLLKSVHKVSSAMSMAVEIEARRLKQPTAGGTVKAPAWYMAFVCSETPKRNLLQQEKEQILYMVQQEATAQLKKSYPDDFKAVTLNIIRTEVNVDAGKPEEKFNLYVEFETVADFNQNAPSPMDVFRALTTCTSTNFIKSLCSIGGPLRYIIQMAVRLCIWIEVSEVIPDTSPSDGNLLVVKVHIEFFIALVVMSLTAIPGVNQCLEFDEMVALFFSALLSASFPGSFIDMTLKSNPMFEAGLPVARYNMLHQYKAELQFYDPAPDASQLLCKIIQCNVSVLLNTICRMKSPWSDTTELTLGKTAQKSSTGKIYGCKVDLPKKEATETSIVSASPTKHCKQKEVAALKPPSTPFIPQQLSQQQTKHTQPCPAPKKPPVAEKIPPKEVSVGTSDIFVALTLRHCDTLGPSAKHFQELAEVTRDFYAFHLRKRYGTVFQRVDVSINKSLFNMGRPDPRYNVYVQWDLVAHFVSDVNDEPGAIPDRYALCRALVGADCMRYLTKYVRTLVDTPFSQATGVFTEQVNS